MTHIGTSALQALVERVREGFGATGVSLAVFHRGELTDAAVGTANVTLSAPMTPDTLLQIGSTTKVYTAALLLQLADRGLIDLDAPVSSVIPEIRLASDQIAESITPRHLMSMCSGLSNGPYADTGRGDDCVRRYVELLGDLPLVFSPGTAYSYSNSSTVVSGLLVERLTGLCWDDALAENLLRPAGMRDSVSLTEELPYRRVAVGHQPGAGGDVVEQSWTFSRGMGPSGSTLATTAADLARLGQLFLNDGVAQDGTRVLSAEAVRTLQSPQVAVPAQWFANDWCVGPYRKVWDGLEVFGHGGTTLQGSSTLTWIPELDLSVAVIVNNPSLGYPLADAVLGAVLRDWFDVVKPSRPVADPSLVIDPALYIGSYRTPDTRYEVATGDRGLVLVMTASSALMNERIETELHPIGNHRFLALDDRVTSSHNWDLAFSGLESGRAQLIHNGAFAAARDA